MKKLLALCLLIGLAWAMVDKDYIDEGTTSTLPHHVLTSRQTAVLVDSSGNCYTSWTQIQQCLSFNPTLGNVQFLCRGYDPTGDLYTHQAPADFSFWVSDWAYDNTVHGNARYPTSLASSGATNAPHIGFPVLVPGPAFGIMAGNVEPNGWFTALWGTPVAFTADIQAPRSVAQELPTGDIVFFADCPTTIHYETWSADLTTQLASGDLGTNANAFGSDCNGGTCYVFSYGDPPASWTDPYTDSISYWTTTDGINWSAEQYWELQVPAPYPTNLWNGAFGAQMALTDAGNPILVFHVEDFDDAVWPFSAKVYVSTASGATSIQVSDDTYDAAIWPTIATGGNYVVVFMHVHTNAETDSFARMDHCHAFSTDNGANWSPVYNNTADEPNKPGLGQIAKRVDATNGNFFYYYGVCLTAPNLDPDHSIGGPGTGHAAEPHAWYVGHAPIVGVAEHETDMPKFASLNFAPNPASRTAVVSYALSKAGNVSLKMFDLAGREVNTVESGYRNAGIYNVNVNTRNLASGTYFLVLDTPEGNISRSLIVVH